MSTKQIEATEVARGVIARYAGADVANSLKLEIIPSKDGKPVYEIADNGKTLRGSSPVAITKAFYQNAFDKEAGICTWSARRFDAEKAFSPSEDSHVECPVNFIQYLNVVTFGYSTPYWSEERWIQELDWMNLHGVNMCLAEIANEEIAARVWRKLGLSDEEIDAFFVGPAHLPWFRMGNITGWPDHLPQQWRDRSVRLQHKILDEMRARQMEPIVPGFAGFMPKAIQRLHPEIELLESRWDTYHCFFMQPSSPLFRKLAKMYVEEWENEFGKCKYYIADPFNELKLPWEDEKVIQENLAICGENIYKGMTDANPDAVWVMQGWIFLDRKTWTHDRLEAMSRAVPDDKMLIIDLAVDYITSGCRKSGMNWDVYKGYCGKQWIWSVIPCMGGSTDFGFGPVEFYANGRLEAMETPNRGNMIGFGMAPEGIENNEIDYELLCDVYWKTSYTPLRKWLMHYARARYGKCPPKMTEYMDALLRGPFQHAHGHPRCRWQASPAEPHWKRPAGKTWENWDPTDKSDWWGYVPPADLAARDEALAALEACAPEFEGNEIYKWDLADLWVHVNGYKVDKMLFEEQKERELLHTPKALELRAQIRQRMLEMDERLKGHPTLDLRRWIKFARDCAEGDEKLADFYESNARRLVTIWGPPTNDYSARVWSGLIGSFYLGRLDEWWYLWDNGLPSKFLPFENKWVEGLLPIDK